MHFDLSQLVQYKPLALQLLAAYGGVSALFDIGVAKLVRPAVDFATDLALKNPAAKWVLVKYETQILGAITAARDEFQKRIDAAKVAAAAPTDSKVAPATSGEGGPKP